MKLFPIKTPHFILTKMAAGDGDKYYKLCNNPNVMKFVTGSALSRPESDEMLSAFLLENEGDPYLGRYFIEDRYNGDLIGAAKLDKLGSEIEIGYRIQEEHWGKGIATEIASGLISFAKKRLGTNRVIAFVNVGNAASIRVLEKAGMQNVQTIEDLDEIKYKFSYSPQKDSIMKKVLGMISGFRELRNQ